jgi:acyl transferase domain-containing protein
VVGSLERDKPERAAMLRGLGELYARGYPVEFQRVYPRSAAVPLPTYPFQRQRYWLEQVETTPLLLRHRVEQGAGAGRGGRAAAREGQDGGGGDAGAAEAPAKWGHRLTWQEVAPPPSAGARRLLIFAAARDVTVDVAVDVTVDVAVARARTLAALLTAGGHECALLEDEARWDAARVAELAAGRPFHAAVVLDALDEEEAAEAEAEVAVQERVARRAASVVRALVALEGSGSPPLWLVTRGGQSVGGEVPATVAAALWGLGRALASEAPAMRCGLLDLEPGVDDAE